MYVLSVLIAWLAGFGQKILDCNCITLQWIQIIKHEFYYLSDIIYIFVNFQILANIVPLASEQWRKLGPICICEMGPFAFVMRC
ncbi:hypothetical protein RIF29_27853 [Crotalaria pallida]|uniref:Uncharacterized protein n=1 Tax=Crotalaria pallida TaxID=3830 RepID=A0AAN9EPV1_CROPI